MENLKKLFVAAAVIASNVLEVMDDGKIGKDDIPEAVSILLKIPTLLGVDFVAAKVKLAELTEMEMAELKAVFAENFKCQNPVTEALIEGSLEVVLAIGKLLLSKGV